MSRQPTANSEQTAATETQPMCRQWREALAMIDGGADVFDRDLDECLRQIEFEYPDWLMICCPMGEYAADERRPLCGAILMREGREALQR